MTSKPTPPELEILVLMSALPDWQESVGKDIRFMEEMKTDLGFCNYFLERHDIFIYGRYGELPVLESLIDKYSRKDDLGINMLTVAPVCCPERRVEILQEAIKILEEKINHQ